VHLNPQTIRRWHLYLGLLTAPSILFFALTGAAQLFHLHEAHDSYQPLALVEKMASLHKDQVFQLGHHQAGPPPAVAGESPQAKQGQEEDRDSRATTLLKCYFLFVALALAITSGFGIWIAMTQTRSRAAAWRLLIAGILIPVALVLI
jgi:hypothetical protein